MINPNATHRLSGKVTKIETNGVQSFTIKSGGCEYSGYDINPRFKVGDRVTFHVQFYITSDRYGVVKDSVRMKRGFIRPSKALNRSIDSHGTLTVTYLDKGQVNTMTFSEGEHSQADRLFN